MKSNTIYRRLDAYYLFTDTKYFMNSKLDTLINKLINEQINFTIDIKPSL